MDNNRIDPPKGFGYIYLLIINNSNYYIGHTKQRLDRRLRGHKSKSKKKKDNSKLYNKIYKYIDFLKIEMIDIAPIEEILSVEAFYIKSLKVFTNKDEFLNVDLNPDKNPLYCESAKSKRIKNILKIKSRKKRSKVSIKMWSDPIFKLENSKKIKNATNTPEEKKRRSESAKKKWEDPVYRENQQKYRETSLYQKNRTMSQKNRKKIQHIETGIIYDSIREAARETKTIRSLIMKHCKNLVKNPKWKYI